MNPCLNCKGRYPGCPTRCKREDHIQYDAKQKQKREAIAKAKAELSIIETCKATAIARTKRLCNYMDK